MPRPWLHRPCSRSRALHDIKFPLAKVWAKVAAHAAVVGLVGESGGRFAGVSWVRIDEGIDGDRRSGGYIF